LFPRGYPLRLANQGIWGDNPTMTVIADAKKRVVLPMVKPGDRFDVQSAGEGKLIITRLEPVAGGPVRVREETENGYSVLVTEQPIDMNALKEALEEFP
jgi:hypothetical protein